MKKKRWKIVVTIVAVIIVGMAVAVFLNLPKPLTTTDSAYNLSQMAHMLVAVITEW